jgi:uncharacterized protein
VRIVLDTNVLISGVFFGGVPGKILHAWRDGRLSLVLSPAILAEYREVGAELESRYGGSDFESFATLLVLNCELLEAPATFAEPVCSDPDDDKFLACALTASVPIIVSGDLALLRTSGWNGIQVLKPRTFLEYYLQSTEQ